MSETSTLISCTGKITQNFIGFVHLACLQMVLRHL